MILDPSERVPRRKPDPLDAELDALVAREVDALSARRTRPAVTRRVADGKTEVDAASPQRASQPEDTCAVRTTHADAQARAGKVRPHDSNVIGIRRAARSGGTDGVLFSAEEEAFIEQCVAFLKPRENADVIIEEVWTHSVLDHQDSLDDAPPDEALSPEQVDELGPDALPGEPSPRPDGSSVTAPHAVTAIQSGRGKDRSILDATGASDAIAPNSAPRPAPRPAPLQRSKPKATDDFTSGGATE